MKYFRLKSMCFLLALLTITGCARHNQTDVQALLMRWFALGDTVYFSSKFRCTAAVYDLRSVQVKSALRIETEIQRGLMTLRRTGTMALRLEGESPNQVFLSVMNADRAVGVPVQVAAVLSRNCMDLETEGVFHTALINPASLFVWQQDEESLVVLDPDQKKVILASGVNYGL